MDQEKKDQQHKESGLGGDLRNSVQQIWLAGLGALAKAEEEGEKMFRNLVKAGEEVGSRKPKEELDEESSHSLGSNFQKARELANESWTRMEKMFDERMASSLERLGIPRKEDIDELREKVDQLAAKVEKLSQEQQQSSSSSGVSLPGEERPKM